jgi:dihydrofolate reductase
MRNVIYSMGVSLDGFTAGPDGDFAWSAPDEELHRFHNEQARELGVHLCGRRLYEVMVTGDVADEVARLREQPGDDIGVGGPELASALIERNLVDEYRLFVSPVIVGGGTPFFPAGEPRIDLELVETRTFGSRVVYLRYRRA